jgi:hypothetical protein
MRRFAVFLGFGRDGQSGNAWRTSDRVFSTSRPPVALENVAGGFSLDQEHEAVTIITLASRRAAPTNPTPDTYEAAQQAYADASNGLSMARHYLQQGNFAAAQRKMVQALAAVRGLQTEGGEA